MGKRIDLFSENTKYLQRKQSNVYKVFESGGMLLSALFREGFTGLNRIIERKKINLTIRMHTTKRERLPKVKNEYKNERVAVYTALFGRIDTILEPLVIDENVDYYIITDQEVPQNSIWKKLPVDLSVVESYSDRQKNRYFKMHANDLFKEYAYYIYLDSNISIYGKLSELIKYIDPATGIGVHNMPNRGNIYEEIFARSLIDPRDKSLLEKQKNDYLAQEFGGNEGMFECNVLVMMNSGKCKEIMERWWEEYKKYPARDQVSFPYVLWVLSIPQDEIGIIGNCMRLNPYFRIKEHVIQ